MTQKDTNWEDILKNLSFANQITTTGGKTKRKKKPLPDFEPEPKCWPKIELFLTKLSNAFGLLDPEATRIINYPFREAFDESQWCKSYDSLINNNMAIKINGFDMRPNETKYVVMRMFFHLENDDYNLMLNCHARFEHDKVEYQSIRFYGSGEKTLGTVFGVDIFDFQYTSNRGTRELNEYNDFSNWAYQSRVLRFIDAIQSIANEYTTGVNIIMGTEPSLEELKTSFVEKFFTSRKPRGRDINKSLIGQQKTTTGGKVKRKKKPLPDFEPSTECYDWLKGLESVIESTTPLSKHHFIHLSPKLAQREDLCCFIKSHIEKMFNERMYYDEPFRKLNQEEEIYFGAVTNMIENPDHQLFFQLTVDPMMDKRLFRLEVEICSFIFPNIAAYTPFPEEIFEQGNTIYGDAEDFSIWVSDPDYSAYFDVYDLDIKNIEDYESQIIDELKKLNKFVDYVGNNDFKSSLRRWLITKAAEISTTDDEIFSENFDTKLAERATKFNLMDDRVLFSSNAFSFLVKVIDQNLP